MGYAVASFTLGEPTTEVRPSKTQKLGIEIEVENVRLGSMAFNPPLAFWNIVGDGSLRNHGAEFVSKVLDAEQTEEALKEFYAHWHPRGLQATMRCGIHVHMNCLPLMVSDLAGIFTTYALLEPFLMNVCGNLREENIYCVPWYRSTIEADKAAMLVKDPKEKFSTLRMVVHQACKYAALNFAPLERFGTLEFRHAPTWDNVTPTLSWTRTLLRIMEYGAKRNPTDILDAWHRDSESWYRLVLGQFCPSVLQDHIRAAEEIGAVSVAEKFLPITKTKAQNWGTPALHVQGVGHEGYAESVPQDITIRGQTVPRPPRPARGRTTIEAPPLPARTTWDIAGSNLNDFVVVETAPEPPQEQVPIEQQDFTLNALAQRAEQARRERIDQMLRDMQVAAQRTRRN